MQDDYKVLGLAEDATPQEIKKAYFAMVRRYSPEENPDKFREIREAYERLQNADQQPKGPVFPLPAENLARQYLKEIERCRKSGQVVKARDVAEEARKYFPDEIQFTYFLAISQRRAGNTGKAVKNCEWLVKKEPDNMWFWREMAISYLERGYNKKAFPAFEKAYELGCRDNDFVLLFAHECEGTEHQDLGVSILFEMVRQDRHWDREEIPDIVEAFMGLMSMIRWLGHGEVLDEIEKFCKKYPVYLEEHLPNILATLIAPLAQDLYVKEDLAKVQEILSFIRKSCRSEESKSILAKAREVSQAGMISVDDRLSDTLKMGAEAILYAGADDPQFEKYMILDAKLCMIEEREEILPMLDLIKEEYPIYYSALGDFAKQLRAGNNLDYLKSNLLEQYCRLSSQMGGGSYFEKYPQEKKRRYGERTESENTGQPYVRGTKKVGRNDPCPCGSGKKYKNCCGRKRK